MPWLAFPLLGPSPQDLSLGFGLELLGNGALAGQSVQSPPNQLILLPASHSILAHPTTEKSRFTPKHHSFLLIPRRLHSTDQAHHHVDESSQRF